MCSLVFFLVEHATLAHEVSINKSHRVATSDFLSYFFYFLTYAITTLTIIGVSH